MKNTLARIILVGGAGTVGKPILDVLLEDPKDNFHVTVLSRHDSTTSFSFTPQQNANVKVEKADYNDIDALIAVFTGHDAIIHTSAIPGLSGQTLMIEAAVKAGVKRFIVNEFANSYINQPGLLQELERYRDVKRDILVFAKRKAVETDGAFSWSALATGNMLDLSLKQYAAVIGIEVQRKKAKLVDDGSERFTAVVMRDIGVAVRGMLRRPEETRDRFCHVRSVETSQMEVVKAFEELMGEEWKVEFQDGEELYRRGKEAFEKGETRGRLDLLVCQLFQKGKGRSIVVSKHESDNELLDVREKDTREIVRDVLVSVKSSDLQ